MRASASREHRIGDAVVIIDVNESETPGPGFRDLIFRVRRGSIVSVYRCRLADAEMPTAPYDAAAYLLTQAHRRSFLFAYTESLTVVRK